MSNPVYTRRPAETLGSDALAELALDLRWSFNHAADTIWQQLDPVLWNLTHNPRFVLQTVSRERLDAVTADREFQQLVDGLVREKRHAEESPADGPAGTMRVLRRVCPSERSPQQANSLLCLHLD